MYIIYPQSNAGQPIKAGPRDGYCLVIRSTSRGDTANPLLR